MKTLITTVSAVVVLGAVGLGIGGRDRDQGNATETKGGADEAVATVAGGCFWGMEALFEELPGVTSVLSGYTGGTTPDPSYKQVCSGTTGHAEAVQVHYDPMRISYRRLLEVFWQHVDPTDGRGASEGRRWQYRTAIFYHTEAQKHEAEAEGARLESSGRVHGKVATPIVAAGPFYPAEAYHQDYYKKHRLQCAAPPSVSDAPAPSSAACFVKPADKTLRKTLTPLQYRVTQEEGTERPFHNAYWDNKEPGLYVDVVSGEPLFSSTDKFESGTGWPSFTRPLADTNVVAKTDHKLLMARTEVRSKQADSHLGHVFDDGPAPTGKRYCINSAALRFIPADKLEAEGYGAWTNLFSGARQ